jgi:hypothetical protein
MAPDEVDAVGGLGIVAEVAVGLVQDHERRIAAQRADQSLEPRSKHDGRGGVMRGADDDGLGPRGHPALHVLEVRLIALEWARDDRRARECRLRAVRLEGRVRDEDLVARIVGGASDQRKQFVRPIARHEPARGHTEPLAEHGA